MLSCKTISSSLPLGQRLAEITIFKWLWLKRNRFNLFFTDETVHQGHVIISPLG